MKTFTESIREQQLKLLADNPTIRPEQRRKFLREACPYRDKVKAAGWRAMAISLTAERPVVRTYDHLTPEELFDLLRDSNIRWVFWVCPNGCRGHVVWSSNCTEATCQTCGAKKSDPRCPYCGKTTHNEDSAACPKRVQDADRFVAEWKKITN